MALKIIEQVRYCANCRRQTLQRKNTKEMSWLMHLVLTIFTFGVWGVFWLLTLIWHGFTKPMLNDWICADCGSPRAAAGGEGMSLSSMAALALVVIILLLFIGTLGAVK